MSIATMLVQGGRYLAVSASLASTAAGLGQTTSINVERIAVSGEVIPGVNDGSWFSGFELPRLNGDGEAAFKGFIVGPEIDPIPSVGMYFWDGAAEEVVRRGNAAPGLAPGATFYDFPAFSQMALNNDGDLAFRGELAARTDGLWHWDGAALTSVIQESAEAPGLPGSIVTTIQSAFSMNHQGDVGFLAHLHGQGHSMWVGPAAAPVRIAQEGQPVPGAPGLTFGTPANVLVNGAGQVFSRVNTNSASGMARSIWNLTPGSESLIVSTDQPPPGLDASLTLIDLSTPMINEPGDVAFFARLLGPGITDKNDRGIWVASGGAPELRVRTGWQAPGMTPGVTFSDLSTTCSLNNHGDISFSAMLSGAGVDFQNERGIWRTEGDSFIQIAQEGDRAPGTPADIFFDDFPHAPLLNDLGQVAFMAGLREQGAIDLGMGIFLGDALGELFLVAREGGAFTVAPGDVRIVDSLSMLTESSLVDGHEMAFNNAGQLAFRLTFTDNTMGIFIATVPAPAGVTCFGCAMIVFGGRRRRVGRG